MKLPYVLCFIVAAALLGVVSSSETWDSLLASEIEWSTSIASLHMQRLKHLQALQQAGPSLGAVPSVADKEALVLMKQQLAQYASCVSGDLKQTSTRSCSLTPTAAANTCAATPESNPTVPRPPVDSAFNLPYTEPPFESVFGAVTDTDPAFLLSTDSMPQAAHPRIEPVHNASNVDRVEVVMATTSTTVRIPYVEDFLFDYDDVRKLSLRAKRIIQLVITAVAVYPCATCEPNHELRFYDADNVAGSHDALIGSVPLARANSTHLRVTNLDTSLVSIAHQGGMHGVVIPPQGCTEGTLVVGWSDGALDFYSAAAWRELRRTSTNTFSYSQSSASMFAGNASQAPSQDAPPCLPPHTSRLITRVHVNLEARVAGPPSEPVSAGLNREYSRDVMATSVYGWRSNRVVSTVFAHGLLSITHWNGTVLDHMWLSNRSSDQPHVLSAAVVPSLMGSQHTGHGRFIIATRHGIAIASMPSPSLARPEFNAAYFELVERDAVTAAAVAAAAAASAPAAQAPAPAPVSPAWWMSIPPPPSTALANEQRDRLRRARVVLPPAEHLPPTMCHIYQTDAHYELEGEVRALTIDAMLPNRFFAVTARGYLLSFGIAFRTYPPTCQVDERYQLSGSVPLYSLQPHTSSASVSSAAHAPHSTAWALHLVRGYLLVADNQALTVFNMTAHEEFAHTEQIARRIRGSPRFMMNRWLPSAAAPSAFDSAASSIALSVLDDRGYGNQLGHILVVSSPQVGLHVFRTLLPLWEGKAAWGPSSLRLPMVLIAVVIFVLYAYWRRTTSKPQSKPTAAAAPGQLSQQAQMMRAMAEQQRSAAMFGASGPTTQRHQRLQEQLTGMKPNFAQAKAAAGKGPAQPSAGVDNESMDFSDFGIGISGSMNPEAASFLKQAASLGDRMKNLKDPSTFAPASLARPVADHHRIGSQIAAAAGGPSEGFHMRGRGAEPSDPMRQALELAELTKQMQQMQRFTSSLVERANKLGIDDLQVPSASPPAAAAVERPVRKSAPAAAAFPEPVQHVHARDAAPARRFTATQLQAQTQAARRLALGKM